MDLFTQQPSLRWLTFTIEKFSLFIMLTAGCYFCPVNFHLALTPFQLSHFLLGFLNMLPYNNWLVELWRQLSVCRNYLFSQKSVQGYQWFFSCHAELCKVRVEKLFLCWTDLWPLLSRIRQETKSVVSWWQFNSLEPQFGVWKFHTVPCFPTLMVMITQSEFYQQNSRTSYIIWATNLIDTVNHWQ